MAEHQTTLHLEDVMARLAGCRDVLQVRFGVLELSVFGSVSRGEAGPDSDVDILVRFEGPARFLPFMDLKIFLELQLGRRVDLVTGNALHPRIGPRILREAVHVPGL
jgi:predicted nucleotidyltransferase